jgi:biopolymer transport protein ExbD
MRRPSYHHDRRGRLEVKMTPMIDVIFLLLIFFVCTASFQAAEEVLPTNLSLPGTVDADIPVDPEWEDLEQIVINLFWRAGRVRWQISGRDYDRLEDVRAVLAAMAGFKADLPVILDVDGNVPLENVIDVYDLCRQIGLRRIQFAVSREV